LYTHKVAISQGRRNVIRRICEKQSSIGPDLPLLLRQSIPRDVTVRSSVPVYLSNRTSGRERPFPTAVFIETPGDNERLRWGSQKIVEKWEKTARLHAPVLLLSPPFSGPSSLSSRVIPLFPMLFCSIARSSASSAN